MKKEYHRDTESTWVSYEAGRVCDGLGSPTPYWSCCVAYTWCMHRHAYWVYTVQVVGFGAADSKVTQELEMGSLREVHRYLRHFRDMEACYQHVYGE